MQKHIENAKPTSTKERDLVSGGVMSDKIALHMSISDRLKHSGDTNVASCTFPGNGEFSERS
jgi:hypothetical protein